MAHLTLNLEGLASGDTIELGDEELSRAVLGVDLPTDPRDRDLVVTRGEREVLRESVSLAEGQSRTLTFTVSPDLRVSNDDGGSPDEAPAEAFEASDDGGGDDTGLIVGVVVGVGVAVVAAAVITTVLVVDGSSSPHQGSLGDGVIEFE